MEHQCLEWKESWRDEYLKELCAFANAGGGTLLVGVNDRGVAVGVAQAKRLLEDLPNKIRDKLGVVADVSLELRDGKECLRIDMMSYPSLISYNGRFYYRSGSTVQELNGNTLHGLLLGRQGVDWDAVPVPKVSIEELSERAFDLFRRKAVTSGREPQSFLMESRESILRNLKLMRDGLLTRAAIILFHPDPEQYVFGSAIRVGYFRNDADLLFQDVLSGPLMEQLDILEGMFRIKYLKAYIYYKGFQRIDDYLFPWEALREAILNAVIHKDYGERIPVAIKVFESQILIYNPGHLPEGWTPETLLIKHESKPKNPLLAHAFYRCGDIEAWGRGIGKIISICHEAQIPPPVYSDGASICTLFDASEKLARLKEVTGDDPDHVSSATSSEQKAAPEGEQKATPEGEQKAAPEGEQKAAPAGERKAAPAGERKKATGRGRTEQLSATARIIQLMKEQPTISRRGLAAQLARSESAIYKQLCKLRQQGKIRRVGPDKGGHWEVLE